MFLYPTPSICHILIAAVGIHFFRQSSGIDATLFYGPTIFQKAVIASTNHLLLSTIAIGVVKLIFVLVATFTLDKIGRCPLLPINVIGMVVSLVGLTTGLTIINHYSTKIPSWGVRLCVTTAIQHRVLRSGWDPSRGVQHLDFPAEATWRGD